MKIFLLFVNKESKDSKKFNCKFHENFSILKEIPFIISNIDF